MTNIELLHIIIKKNIISKSKANEITSLNITRMKTSIIDFWFLDNLFHYNKIKRNKL